MCRLAKEGGVVAFTCAGVGRMEHGTTRSDKGYSSPFTVSRGDEYYGNVSKREASKSVALEYWFDMSAFFDQTSTKDLYFAGLKKSHDVKAKNNFESLIKKLQLEYPEKKYLIRFWTLKFLPFRATDFCLRLLHQLKINFFYWVKPVLYRLYVVSGFRKIRHLIAGNKKVSE